MSFEEFQDGHHGHRNGTNLAILNLHVVTMPPTKFQLNPIYGSGGDVENVKSFRRTNGRRTDGRMDDGQQAIAKLQVS